MADHAVAEHRPTYISEMMERLGIDPGEGAVPRLSLSYVTAFHRCEACGDKQACREWLDSMPRSVVSTPRFCPNADILFELAVNQPRLNPSSRPGSTPILPISNGSKTRSTTFWCKSRRTIR